MKIDRRRPDVLVADGLFHATQLRALESIARTANYESQQLSPGGVRDRQRAVLDNPQIEALLWDALAPIVGEPADWFEESASPVQSPPIGGWAFTGCNPRTRAYSYGLGGSFSPHQDEAWQPNQATKTLLTVLVYLPAGDCVGGETVVDGEIITVEPGRLAVFDHRLLHEGKAVEKGAKLVLRNDIVAVVRPATG